jgi:hypothetical protein
MRIRNPYIISTILNVEEKSSSRSYHTMDMQIIYHGDFVTEWMISLKNDKLGISPRASSIFEFHTSTNIFITVVL